VQLGARPLGVIHRGVGWPEFLMTFSPINKTGRPRVRAGRGDWRVAIHMDATEGTSLKEARRWPQAAKGRWGSRNRQHRAVVNPGGSGVAGGGGGRKRHPSATSNVQAVPGRAIEADQAQLIAEMRQEVRWKYPAYRRALPHAMRLAECEEGGGYAISLKHSRSRLPQVCPSTR